MEQTENSGVFLSFYGDDFTGSTDVMESLTLNGVPAALFLEPPSPEEVKRFRLKNTKLAGASELSAFGVPGVSRSMNPQQMSAHLPEIFERISQVPSRFFHYKVCSTFDSSPEVGNIGHAVEIALKYFPSRYIPLVVGAPSLNRFCTFGNLFARVKETTYRLDRHPTMSRHPVTPMNESDLRLHLGKQTTRPVDLVDVLSLEASAEHSIKKVQHLIGSSSAAYLLFDVLNHGHLLRIGNLLIDHPSASTQLIVGSSAVENALAAYLQDRDEIRKVDSHVSAGSAERLVVMVGSCSPASQKQTEWAVGHGFEGIRINATGLIDPESEGAEIQRTVAAALQALKEKNVVLYSALGPDDPAISETRERLSKRFAQGEGYDYLPRLQGTILKEILKNRLATRVVVAGGDTSGHVSRALGIYALEVLAPIAPGAPLCLAHSTDPLFDGLEIALKGGQNGDERYFESILAGHQLS